MKDIFKYKFINDISEILIGNNDEGNKNLTSQFIL